MAISLFVGVGSGAGLCLMGIPPPVTFGLLAGLLNVVRHLGSKVAGALLTVPAAVVVTTLVDQMTEGDAPEGADGG